MNPKGEWHILQNGQASTFGTTPLRIDTLAECNGTACIIDSKFYPFALMSNGQSPNGHPDTYSIVKQVFYAMYFSNLSNGKNVKNIFILPYDCHNLPFGSGPFAYVGYALLDLPTIPQSLKEIPTFLIDFKHLLMNWRNGTTSRAMQELQSCCPNVFNEKIR